MWDFETNSDKVAAINEQGERLLYSGLLAEVHNVEPLLRDRPLVFLLCSNTLGALMGYVGCIENRAVPLLLSSHLDKELLAELISRYKPDYLWAPSHMAGAFSEYGAVYESFSYMLLETGFHHVYPLFENLCLLLTTSGSTGSPKLVRQSDTNVFENANSIMQYLELDDSERPITTLPMNYTYGLSIINSHLLVGATLLMTDKGLMQKEFWQFLKEMDATSFGGVPYTYEMLERLRFERMQLPSLRTMTQAGGKLTPELHEKFATYAAETQKKFIVMYGQCEATARMGYLPAEKAVEKKGSMGIAIPGGAFHLEDEDGIQITAPYTTGELIYMGKNVTLGYAERGEDLIKGDEWHGILRTGDMAQVDEDGYYYIVGRKKRFLKIYGNRVNLDEIDRLVKGRFSVECVSAGVDDHLCLFVTDAGIAPEIRTFAAAKTGLHPSAFRLVVLDEIPKNDAGKPLYQELEKYC